jgi:MGT family glycosyltransferase
MSDQCNAAEVQATGATFIAYTHAPNRHDKSAASTRLKDYAASNPLQAFLMFRDLVMVGPALAYAQDVLTELAHAPADALIVNDGLLGPMLAAEAVQLPYAMILPHHYLYPTEGLPPPGMMTVPARNGIERLRDRLINRVILRAFDGALPALNATRAHLGLPPDTTLLAAMQRADRVLVLTSPAFDFSSSALPSNVRYVGPMLADPFRAEPTRTPIDGSNDVPLVIVSFSTTFQNQQPVIQKVIDALGMLSVRGLVTVGPALADATFRLPSNVTVQHLARHSELFPQASAVVTHGGHGTVVRALAHGIPLVCLPMGRDQPGNAARVVARNAGISLSPSASVATIRNAINRVITHADYRSYAQHLASAIQRDAQSTAPITELEALPRLPYALSAAH